MPKPEEITGIKDMSEVSERRLWKTLDNIAGELSGIKGQLSNLVRLEERVHSHEEINKRFGRRLDDHGDRVRNIELWQANHGDRSSNERLIANVQSELKVLQKAVANMQNFNSRFAGQTDVGKRVLQWLVGLLSALLLWALTKS